MRQRPLSSLFASSLNLLFPPQCLCCEAIVSCHGTLCGGCWNAIRFIAEPVCDRCGYPFEYDMGEGALCGTCLREPPAFLQARAVFHYDDASRLLVTRLKYQDETALAPIYGPWLLKAGSALAQRSDLIVPVPLHYRRFVRRRYNQAALLALGISRSSGLPHLPGVLIRRRPTLPQTGLKRSLRQANVHGAFAVRTGGRRQIEGKRILLVDDVYTTGATLDACVRALLAAEAAEVRALTLARAS